MNSLNKQLFGKLEINMSHCTLFYVFMVMTFALFAFGCISELKAVFSSKKRNTISTLNVVLALVQLFLAYFTNRLLYTMCVRSI